MIFDVNNSLGRDVLSRVFALRSMIISFSSSPGKVQFANSRICYGWLKDGRGFYRDSVGKSVPKRRSTP